MAAAGKRLIGGVTWEEREAHKRARHDSPVTQSDTDSEGEYEEIENQFVEGLTRALELMIDQANERGKVRTAVHDEAKVGIFYSSHKQSFSLAFYIRRLIDYCGCSNSAFVLMLVYMDRVLSLQPLISLSEYNIHRLTMTALVLATKYLEDEVRTNSYYARVGGISTMKEMNKLEGAMLSILNFDLYVDPEEFDIYQSFIYDVKGNF
uniref:Cyclin n=1 Tax=Rhodosorus marinus TaxID=101924 RepID=A0A7S0BL77_9RHOD|mmetsp:Transcript_21635/g.31410  ORF Transcript_21635/g.31410 Transcript_21635/m.31410 type:complete len:207 (+) Transcript_21635:75-695(+)